MKTIKLKRSKVQFHEAAHEYYLGKKQLQGITSTLIRKAFPDTYKDIPEVILAKAAERGGMIHNAIELLNTVFDSDIAKYPSPPQELRDFCTMLETYGLRHIESEYIVTDSENFASAIDGIFADKDDNIYLVDYKTTSTLHYDNVSLQLSIYAKWFEQMNPKLKVKELVCMWFKDGKSKFQPLARISDEKIDELITAYLEGNEDYHYEVEIPQEFASLEQEYRLVTTQIDSLKTRQDELKEKIMQMMEANKQKSIKTTYGSYAYVAASRSKRFDAKLFKDTEPERYEQYMKDVETKASIRIKLN
jgi:hypothetical protein